MLEQTNVQEISQAILVLRELSADEKMRYMAEMREKALHDEATAIHAALEKGMAQGLEQGIARGMKKGLEKGLAQGMAQGLKQGIAQGLEQGIAQGLEQGIAQGLEQGIAEERQRMIENLRKFGLSEEQIQAALHAQENP